jgi:hypothetical protein
MEEELDGEGRVLLTSEPHGTFCDHREEEIEPDTHHVEVRCICMRSPSEAWVDCDISVGAIDEVVNILRGGGEFPDDSCLSRRPVEEADGYDAECPVCGSDEYEGEVLAFAFKPMDHRRDKVQDVHPICHPECEEELADLIERAWEYSDVLLSEQV